MGKRDTFPKENHEKKQLEEIAHLYFSTPAPASKAPKSPREPEGRVRGSVEAFPTFPRALVIHCLEGEPERGLSTWFLFNLAVMLKILNGPVLLIGSVRACEERFLFGFRPDRERLKINDGPQILSGSFGPMGICLLDGRLLWRGLEDEGRSYTIDPVAGRRVAFRYILSNEVRPDGAFRSLPGLALLLVTPTTTTSGLLDRAEGVDDDFFPGLGHAGIVVAGVGCAEEADALYLYWRDKLKERYDGDLAVENFGVFPSEAAPPPLDLRLRWNEGVPSVGALMDVGPSGVGVLEAPYSARARFCQATAALIRRKRAEMLQRNS